MIKVESDCVSCGLPCRGVSCPYYAVKHYYCDECGAEDVLYYYDNKQLCMSCVTLIFNDTLIKVQDGWSQTLP